MLYTVIIEVGDDDTAWGVEVPDIPGCYSAGDTLDEAIANAKAAIEGHLEVLADGGEQMPLPAPARAHITDIDFHTHLIAVIDVDITPFLGKSQKINVTLPDLLLRKIDDYVDKKPKEYKNRSYFLQKAALIALDG
jgi:predicted RNase H-like HicB family nuclease